MTERKLATIETIASLSPIEGADRIEVAKVRGWEVVVQKGLYEVGDPVIYFEIDTVLPETDDRFASFMDRGVRADPDGRRGHVVKTMRLRGQYSQGLCMPVDQFMDTVPELGTDVTDTVGVWKWEPPIPASLSGKMRGGMPGWVRKTDAERVQNFADFLPLNPEEFYCTEKIDGSSATFTLNGDDFHVCSRNIDLYDTEGNTFWEIARKHEIEKTLRYIREQWALAGSEPSIVTLQGEVYGEGINGNRLALKGHHFAAFNLECAAWDRVELRPWTDIYEHLCSWDKFPVVPLLDIPAPHSVESALEAVDGIKSTIAKDRLAEGVVWRRKDMSDIVTGVRSLKAISNKYLLKEK
jgi:RNA ligase (TIGR02306 family)